MSWNYLGEILCEIVKCEMGMKYQVIEKGEGLIPNYYDRQDPCASRNALPHGEKYKMHYQMMFVLGL